MQTKLEIEQDFSSTIHFDINNDFILRRTIARAETDPIALFTLAQWAVSGDLEAEQALFKVNLDYSKYRQAVQNNILILPQLAVLLDYGFLIVRSLLVDLIKTGPEEYFFLIAGTVAEGSQCAVSLLNETASEAHLKTLVRLTENYQDDSNYGPMLRSIISHPEFFPEVLLGLEEDSDLNHLVAFLSYLGNPFAQSLVYIPEAVGYH